MFEKIPEGEGGVKSSPMTSHLLSRLHEMLSNVCFPLGDKTCQYEGKLLRNLR